MWSSHEAAPAASTREREPRRIWVVSHHALAAAHFVRISIPKNSFICDDRIADGMKAICFNRQISNGYLNCYLFDKDPSKYRGQTIFAQVVVVQEVLNDGRAFIAIHLLPTPAGAGEVSRMYVLAHDPEDWRLDPTPECIVRTVGGPRGFVAFVSPGGPRLQSKFMGDSRPMLRQVPVAFLEKEREGHQAPVLSARSSSNTKLPPEDFVSTGDSQLDRLLKAGWKVSAGSETPTEVKLFKMKGKERERVEMTHFKPKPRHMPGNGKKR